MKYNTKLLSILILSLFYISGLFTACSTKHQSTQIQPIQIIADIQNGAHGITINSKGQMIVAAKQQLYKVTHKGQISHFATLKTITDTTHIWNIKYGPDGNLYCAAKDFLIQINDEGEQTIVANERFTGRWGSCDLAFDQKGNIYTVHGKTISKFDQSGNRKDLFNWILKPDSIKALVGITFDPTFEHIFVSDLFGHRIIQIPFTPDDKNTQAKSYNVDGYPEYFAWSKKNDLFVSSPGKKRSKLFQLKDNQFIQWTFAEGDSIRGLNTIIFGQPPFLENAIYGLGHGKLYEMKLEK